MKKTTLNTAKATFFAMIIAVGTIFSSCQPKTCYDPNTGAEVRCDGSGGIDNQDNIPWWDGPFTGVTTIQVRVKDSQLLDKQNMPQNCSVLTDEDRSGFVDWYLSGIDHRNLWVQGLITYNGITYRMKFITKNIGSLKNGDVIDVSVSEEADKPFALNVNSYLDFGPIYFDSNGEIPLVWKNAQKSALYKAEPIYAKQ